MSNELIKAADDARKLLRGFQAFAEVSAALDQAGRAVQAQAEAEKALATLQTQIDVSKKQIAKHKEQADKVLADAKAEADALIAAAVAQSTKLFDDAECERKKIVELCADALAASKAEADKATAEVIELAAARDGLLQECSGLEARLAKAQDRVSKLLGG